MREASKTAQVIALLQAKERREPTATPTGTVAFTW
jgi:hypothetical protein